MTDGLKKRAQAAEESYFDKANRLAMEQLARRVPTESRKSPVTGKPMEQRVMDGITVDVCPDSGGIWLDGGELEALIKVATEKEGAKANSSGSWLASLLKGK
jgi:hypothetical protein